MLTYIFKFLTFSIIFLWSMYAFIVNFPDISKRYEATIGLKGMTQKLGQYHPFSSFTKIKLEDWRSGVQGIFNTKFMK